MNKLTYLLALSILTCTTCVSAEIAIVVHPANSDPIDLEDAERIFLGKMKSFPSGSAATPLNQVEASPERKEFDDKVLEKNSSQLRAYWSRLVFTGKGRPPVELDSDAVKQRVAEDPTAIGYIDASQLDGSVKEVARF